jgi:hypothetical protein
MTRSYSKIIFDTCQSTTSNLSDTVFRYFFCRQQYFTDASAVEKAAALCVKQPASVAPAEAAGKPDRHPFFVTDAQSKHAAKA